jgi:hypothetical protein
VPSLSLTLMMMLLPISPRWLLLQCCMHCLDQRYNPRPRYSLLRVLGSAALPAAIVSKIPLYCSRLTRVRHMLRHRKHLENPAVCMHRYHQISLRDCLVLVALRAVEYRSEEGQLALLMHLLVHLLVHLSIVRLSPPLPVLPPPPLPSGLSPPTLFAPHLSLTPPLYALSCSRVLPPPFPVLIVLLLPPPFPVLIVLLLPPPPPLPPPLFSVRARPMCQK